MQLSRQLCMAKEILLCSHVNVRKILELFYVINSTEFLYIPDICSYLSYCEIDYHPGPVHEVADVVFDDPFAR